MKTVNLGSKYDHRITLRLNDDQMNYLVMISNVLGVSPSDYMRMSLNAAMVQFQKEAVGSHENDKTNFYDLV